jgi:hypothetical protein
VGVSKPIYNIEESRTWDPRLAFLYVIFWFTSSHVWLSFMLYSGLLPPTFGFPLCYILVYLLPRLAFLYVIFWFTYSHVRLSSMLYFGLLNLTFDFPLCKSNVRVSKPKYNIKESRTWEEVNQNIT